MVLAVFVAGAAKAAGEELGKEAVQQILGVLEGERAVALVVENDTDFFLTKTDDSHAHGGFKVPPLFNIPPHNLMAFGSQSSGFLTGTEGDVTFTGGGLTFIVSWDNPFIGSNSGDATMSGAETNKYQVDHIIGNGNHSQNRYALIRTAPPDGNPAVQFSSPPVAVNPRDKRLLAMGNRLVVVTQDGHVFSHDGL